VFYNPPPITRAIIVANVAIFLLQGVSEDQLVSSYALWPWNTLFFHGWQIITYAFLHGSSMHLLLNMFGLYMFAPEIESTLGGQRFLIYYLVSIIGAALLHLSVMHISGSPLTYTVGASGGVFGVLLAYGMFFPQRRVLLLIPPIPMRAWVLVTLYGLAELVMGVLGTAQGVAHFAHLGGMLAGFLLLLYWRVKPQDHME